eukprot:COSAG01_NODE_19431_length_1009_cov_22.574910_1_plen_141_part_10
MVAPSWPPCDHVVASCPRPPVSPGMLAMAAAHAPGPPLSTLGETCTCAHHPHTQERNLRCSRLPQPPLLAGSFPSKYVPSTTHTATSVTCRRYRPSPQSPGAQSAPRYDPEHAKKAKKEGAGEGKSLQTRLTGGVHAHTRK